jgi:hypothetical protein
MDLGVLIVGFFLLAVGCRREGHAGFLLGFLALVVVLHGLGFILSPVSHIWSHAPYFMAFVVGFSCIRNSFENRGAIFALIAEVTLLAFVILGSFY